MPVNPSVDQDTGVGSAVSTGNAGSAEVANMVTSAANAAATFNGFASTIESIVGALESKVGDALAQLGISLPKGEDEGLESAEDSLSEVPEDQTLVGESLEPIDPLTALMEEVASLKTMLEEAGLTAGEDEDGVTAFDTAVENAVRRAMGMDEVAEKPEGMPDFLWGMGQGLFDRSLTEKPEDMSDEEWAALTGAWDTGQKAFGVEENPLEQMQTDVEDLKTTVPGMESDIAQAKTMAQDAIAVKGTANSALTLASQALSVAEIARGIAERAQAAAAAAGGTRPGADSPDVDRPPSGSGPKLTK